jgi:VIT1/CCC1 family predicted Fe2+/Mn2+ transporter
MAGEESKKRAPVLDPIERVSEVVFGVLMALTFTGSLSVATAGRDEVRTMMLTALGCNLAWGLTDAVMYLVGTLTERHRKVALLRRLQATQDARVAHRLIAEALPEQLAEGAGEDALEALRKRLAAIGAVPARLGVQDYAGALGVFVLVVLATFPVVIPFMFIGETAIALRVSNALALVTLFIGGFILGRYAGGSPWRYGFGMAAVGVVLVIAIIALGG